MKDSRSDQDVTMLFFIISYSNDACVDLYYCLGLLEGDEYHGGPCVRTSIEFSKVPRRVLELRGKASQPSYY